jgi:hypothetical protein
VGDFVSLSSQDTKGKSFVLLFMRPSSDVFASCPSFAVTNQVAEVNPVNPRASLTSRIDFSEDPILCALVKFLNGIIFKSLPPYEPIPIAAQRGSHTAVIVAGAISPLYTTKRFDSPPVFR